MKANLSAIDLASLLGVTLRTLRRWEEDGSGPKRIVENLEPVYPLETLVPWMRQHYPDIKLGEAAEVTDRAGRLALLEEWEALLCSRYGLKSMTGLYESLRHADFHQKWKDPAQYWTRASYAAFSGAIITHRLTPEKLRNLLADFHGRRDFGLAAKKQMTAREFQAQIEDALREDVAESFNNQGPEITDRRQVHDHVAVAHRYACAMADDYVWPPRDAYIAGEMTPAQLVELNSYLEFVATECKIPAAKITRLAAKRQLDDLARSRQRVAL
jgi:transcriptional regulator with XRE-family HTH domain